MSRCIVNAQPHQGRNDEFSHKHPVIRKGRGESEMARWMALDVGEARIGVAVSDATGFLASPYKTLHVTRDEIQMWKTIQHLIEETESEELVVGLPISLDGAIHSQGKRVQDFAKRLGEHITIPLTFWDERL
jgi:putative Holliday junction resolvase